MEQWAETTLGNIAVKKYGIVDGPFGSNLPARLYTDDGVPIIRGANLSLGEYRFHNGDYRYVAPETANKLKRSNCVPGDIVFTKKGTIGQTGIIPMGTRYARFLLSSNQMKLTVDHDIAIPQYVYYYVSSPAIRAKIIQESSACGVPKTNITYLRAFPIRLPPLPIQRKIASILSAYDDLIENNRRRIQILEEMAQNLYREWFVKFRFPIYSADGAIDRIHNPETDPMVDSPLGPIPKGWEAKKLGNICAEVRRTIKPAKLPAHTPYIGLEHLPRRSITLGNWGTLEGVTSTKLSFNNGEILFGKIRPYFHKVGVALVDGVSSTDAIVIVPNSTKWFPTVLATVSSDEFVAYSTQTSQGTKMPRANWKVLTQYKCPIAPPALMRMFDNTIVGITKQLRNDALRIGLLLRTRDLLLPKLISGKLDISELDISVEQVS